ncbi:MAG: hypothetical protein BGN85_00280 [Alphaproteobacteria bacterium 64-11]|nr:MAG: hypothetical protein BGN85_00280 [Alphaproteobacteria bacterium 64-11]
MLANTKECVADRDFSFDIVRRMAMPQHDLVIGETRLNANVLFSHDLEVNAVIFDVGAADVRLALLPRFTKTKPRVLHFEDDGTAILENHGYVGRIDMGVLVGLPVGSRWKPIMQLMRLDRVRLHAGVGAEDGLKIAFQQTFEQRQAKCLIATMHSVVGGRLPTPRALS